jgi:hypothetical protein
MSAQALRLQEAIRYFNTGASNGVPVQVHQKGKMAKRNVNGRKPAMVRPSDDIDEASFGKF